MLLLPLLFHMVSLREQFDVRGFQGHYAFARCADATSQGRWLTDEALAQAMGQLEGVTSDILMCPPAASTYLGRPGMAAADKEVHRAGLHGLHSDKTGLGGRRLVLCPIGDGDQAQANRDRNAPPNGPRGISPVTTPGPPSGGGQLYRSTLFPSFPSRRKGGTTFG